MSELLIIVLIASLLCGCALGLRWADRRYRAQPDKLVDAVDACLPQIQCAQCGYPGCRPYAAAIVTEGAALNLCPPGGPATEATLHELMGQPQRGAAGVDAPVPLLAVIDETECIGCTLCLPACPVDAIVGAQGYMHTVIARECTGCELCLPPCPVDCIALVPAPVARL
ncbi:MAG: RnfABCDGE type electron transport complex subunit B [Pseudomonadota bacterium]